MAARLVQALPALHNYKFLFILSKSSLDPAVIKLNPIKTSTLISAAYYLLLSPAILILSNDQSFVCVCVMNVTTL